ncbi:MAG: response regulator transcription factor [Chloroflexi bacterium]|nr:response regulator transcription factor [Chloroflexota bacterium]
MEQKILLVIEGRHADHPAFAPSLRRKNFEVFLASNGSQALARLLKDISPDAIIINAASLRTSGKRICQSLREKSRQTPIILIVDKDVVVEKADADVLLHLPFTIQKLVNRVRRLLPGDGKNCIQAGPILLDVEQRTVRSLGKQIRLTPRLVALLQVLLQHRGAVVERKALFSKVWETNYTDDTRTLDVHISWLRQAIEVDPNKPRFLKTVRGVGYRLDV